MKVRVSEHGGVFTEVEINEGATIGEVIRKAGVDTSRSKEIRMDTDLVELDDIAKDGKVIMVIPNIEGGSF